MYRESYKVESCFFPDILKKEARLPVLIVETEQDSTGTGPVKTRIETFIGTIRR